MAMNRHDRRRLGVTGSDNDYTRFLERELAAAKQQIAFQTSQYNAVVMHANHQAAVIQQVESQGRLTIQLSDSVPFDEPAVRMSDYLSTKAALITRTNLEREYWNYFSELRVVITHVDALAVHCDKGKLKAELKGLDVRLNALMTACLGAWREMGMPETASMQQIGLWVAWRANAIQIVGRDGGAELLRVVADTSLLFADAANEIMRRILERADRAESPRKAAIAAFGKAFYYDRAKKQKGWTWTSAARALTRDLLQRELQRDGLDEVDQSILDDLNKKAQEGYAALGDWFRLTYHNATRAEN